MTSLFPSRDPRTGRSNTVRKVVVRSSRNQVLRTPGNDGVSMYALGLDLGQAQDYTAAAVVERLYPPGSTEAIYHVRDLYRFDLGTTYTDVVDRIARIMQTSSLRDRVWLVIDRTGVGAPVADMFLRAGLHPFAVNITNGHYPTLTGRTRNVPRQYLISVLQVLFQTGRIKIAPELELAGALERELINFSARDASITDEHTISWRENEHDDLVFAVMLAVYYFERIARPPLSVVRTGL